MKTNTATLENIKEGDKVILTKRNGDREVREVRTAFGGLIDIGQRTSAYHFDKETGERFPSGGESIQAATPELMAEVEREAAERAAKRLEEHEAQQNDPRRKFIERFNSGFTDWGKLTLEQLQQIAGWLDKD